MLWFDCETYNEVPIKHGTYKYTATCEMLIATFAADDGPVQVWDRTNNEGMPSVLADAFEEPAVTVCSHFSMFDRNVVKHALGIDVPIRRWRDSMVKAYMHGLPGKLELLCDILEIPQDKAKSKEGKRLIQLFTKPQPANHKLRRATRETHPDDWKTFIEYAVSDVEAMRAVFNKLPNWNYKGRELELWHLDQVINDRGVAVDVKLAESAIRAIDKEQKRLKKQVQVATNDEVESATQRQKLLEYVMEFHGIVLPNMKKDTLERVINDPSTDDGVRELLAIRLQASTSSTSKYKTLVKAANDDGRLRGALQFAGAPRTARWAGRLFQPQNMPRPDLPYEEIAAGIEAMLADAAALVCDEIMRYAANAIRGCVVAPFKKKLVIADLKNIEGRAAAHLAGEDWKVGAYNDYDAGVGPDLYKVAYATAFGIPSDFDHKTVEGYFMRQIGKVLELFMQYGGGLGAFVTGAATYGIDIDKLREAALPSISEEFRRRGIESREWFDMRGKTDKKFAKHHALGDANREVLESLKFMWRDRHPGIVSIWTQLEAQALMAIRHQGAWHDVNEHLAFRCVGKWLRLRLPSGRQLCYPNPEIDPKTGAISYKGMNQYVRKWMRLPIYGGKFFENVCQAFSRDVLAYPMPEIDTAGYEIVLTVHDELITETPDDDRFTADELSQLMTQEIPWARGLPLAASGFETYRYRKDD